MDTVSFYTLLDISDTVTQKTIHYIFITFPSAKKYKLSEQKGLMKRQIESLVEAFNLEL